MERQTPRTPQGQHSVVKEKYDEVQSDGRYEEGMARMAVYHRHCQDPVIFRALGDVRGKSLLDLACGDGFYTRRFRAECGADPVVGVDLSPKQIECVGFTPEWHDPFISAEGLETYGAGFFKNYLANPQSKLLHLSKR